MDKVKELEKKALYSKDLMPRLKHCRKTIYNWIKLYRDGGLELLLSSTKGGNNTPLIEGPTKQALVEKLSDPSTQITSYVELLEWVQKYYKPNERKYLTYYICVMGKRFNSNFQIKSSSNIKDFIGVLKSITKVKIN